MRPYNGFSPEVRTRSAIWMSRQFAYGLVSPPSSCEACGQTAGVLEYHAEDYSEPFSPEKTLEFSLCHFCHRALHLRFSFPRRWRDYVSLIEKGYRLGPIWSPRTNTVYDWFRGSSVEIGPPPHEPRDVSWMRSLTLDRAWRHPNAAEET